MRLCDMTHYSTVRGALARDFFGSAVTPTLLLTPSSNLGECLLKIRNEVVNVLDTDGEAHRTLADA